MLLWVVVVFSAQAKEKLLIVTEEYPPYNYTSENGELDGVGTKILNEVLAKVDYDYEIEVLPWARAYHLALNEKNVLIYTISRTKERENLFKWIGVAGPINQAVIKLKDRNDIKLESESDLLKYKSGSIREDIGEQYLKKIGAKNIQSVAKLELNIRKLKAKRIDYIIYNDLAFFYEAKKLKENVDQFEVAFTIDEYSGNTYMAFSDETSDEIVKDFQEALNSTIKSGKYEEIIKNSF